MGLFFLREKMEEVVSQLDGRKEGMTIVGVPTVVDNIERLFENYSLLHQAT